MRWDWEHRSTGGQWTLSIDGWHAVVQRLATKRPLWQATLERTTAPHERHQSPPYAEAMDARSWCLRTIAELAAPTRDGH
jgi:hypothetical protein